MAIGAGSCLYTEDDNVTKEQCTLLEKLLKGCGVCERVPESLMDNLGILTGCGPAFVSENNFYTNKNNRIVYIHLFHEYLLH